MIYGPLSKSDIEILKELLDREGATYTITHSIEDLQNSKDQRKKQIITSYPTYGGADRFLYIDINSSDLLIVRGELEKMGFIVRSKIPQPESEVEEFLCPRCKHYSLEPGTCPKHGVPLLDFSSWVTEKQRAQGLRQRIITTIVIALVVAALVFESLVHYFRFF